MRIEILQTFRRLIELIGEQRQEGAEYHQLSKQLEHHLKRMAKDKSISRYHKHLFAKLYEAQTLLAAIPHQQVEICEEIEHVQNDLERAHHEMQALAPHSMQAKFMGKQMDQLVCKVGDLEKEAHQLREEQVQLMGRVKSQLSELH